MNRCPQCGSNVLIHYDFITPKIFCLDCETLTDDVLYPNLKRGLLWVIYIKLKHLYYRLSHYY